MIVSVNLFLYTPGIFGGIWAQYLHSNQKRATFSYIEGKLQAGKVLRVLNFTQVYLSPKNASIVKTKHHYTSSSYTILTDLPLQTAPLQVSL